MTTGFGHAAILSHANTVIETVKSKVQSVISFWLPAVMVLNGQNYTEFVKQTPDSIVLTLACGKFRFSDVGNRWSAATDGYGAV